LVFQIRDFFETTKDFYSLKYLRVIEKRFVSDACVEVKMLSHPTYV